MAVGNINTISEHTISFRNSYFRDDKDFPIKQVKPKFEKSVEPSELASDSVAWYKKSFNEFCNATALHGYSYIVRPGASRAERIAWVIIVVLAFITSVVLLCISWQYNAATPTTTVIENTHYATWNIPFPAVTLCNMNKISNAAAHKLAAQIKRPANMTDAEIVSKFRMVLHFEGIGRSPDADYAELHELLQDNNLTVTRLMQRIAPRCSDMLERCMWKGTQTRCDNLFQEVNTTEGVCCSFNNHALEQIQYPSKLIHSIPRLPRKVTACGYQTGLTVLAKPFVADYHSTFLSSTGFRVFIHNSYDYPDDNAETKYVTSLSEAFITITPESTYSTEAIQRMSLEERDCYFADERRLNVMQRYTYINCMSECRSALLLRHCGCIPYNYPNNGSAQTCQLDRIQCVHRLKRVYNAALPTIGNGSLSAAGTADTLAETGCECLPDCELLQYSSEITTGRLNRDYSFNSMTFFKDIILEDQTLLHVYFNDLVSTLYRKDATQNWLAILASFGGLLGLLLGFSFVTGFELVYFFTIRPLLDHIISRRQMTRVQPM